MPKCADERNKKRYSYKWTYFSRRLRSIWVSLLSSQFKKNPPSSSAFLPSPSVCFLSSRIPNFWIKFQDGQNTRLFPPPTQVFFFLPGYHVKHHMEQIKAEERQQQEEEEEEALTFSLPSNSTWTITSITNTSASKQGSKYLQWNQTSARLWYSYTGWARELQVY